MTDEDIILGTAEIVEVLEATGVIDTAAAKAVTVSNSNDSYLQVITADLELPDIIHIDSDGTPTPTPAQEVFISTLCGPGSLQDAIDAATGAELDTALRASANQDNQISYRRPPLTGQLISYVSNDDGDNLANDVYEYEVQGIKPIMQGEDSDDADGTQDDWLKLSSSTPNVFGTTDRFTNDVGGTTYAGAGGSTSDYVIDHLTGLGWDINDQDFEFWPDLIITATAHTLGAYSDFRLSNMKELESLMFYGSSSVHVLNYIPFLYSLVNGVWLSTTYVNGSTQAYDFSRFGLITTSTKASANRKGFFCRNHYN